MTSKELNPKHYEASRAGNAVQHYINTQYGSPFRLYSVTQVHKARTEDMAEAGMKYFLEFSVMDWAGESAEGNCSAEVLYPRGETQRPPQVQGSWEHLPQLDNTDKEQEFYKRYSAADSAVSAKDLPDRIGYIDPEMKPFWNLGWAAASFIMLRESNENTLFNMAQVAKITQLKSQDNQLRFEYQILLHDMVSQEIIRWNMLLSWSPEQGVKVSDTELLPRCHCNHPNP
ncbi:latexin isoform X2 [Hoplias malabaricus]